MLDIVGQILFVLMFCTPIITIPIIWRYKYLSKTHRVLLALLFAAVLSFLCYAIGLGILMRDGLGPV